MASDEFYLQRPEKIIFPSISDDKLYANSGEISPRGKQEFWSENDVDPYVYTHTHRMEWRDGWMDRGMNPV